MILHESLQKINDSALEILHGQNKNEKTCLLIVGIIFRFWFMVADLCEGFEIVS